MDRRIVKTKVFAFRIVHEGSLLGWWSIDWRPVATGGVSVVRLVRLSVSDVSLVLTLA